MSFRGRLTLFFLLIVVLPMIVLAVLVTQIATDSTNGKADAQLAEGLDSGLTVYRDEATSAGDAAKKAAHDPKVTAQIKSWGWQDGLHPTPQTPVWPMAAFRDRFLTAFGSTP